VSDMVEAGSWKLELELELERLVYVSSSNGRVGGNNAGMNSGRMMIDRMLPCAT